MPILCYICNKSCVDITAIVRHLKLVHSLYESSKLKLKCCGIGCPHSFSTYSGMRRHMQKCPCLSNFSEDVHNIDPQVHLSVGLVGNQQTVDDIETIPEHVENPINSEKIKEMSGSFLSRLSALGLPSSTIDKIVSSSKELLLPIVEDTKQYIVEHFESGEHVSTVLEKLNSTNELFVGLESKFLRHKYFLKTFNVTEPKELCVGMRYDRTWDSNLGVYVQIPKKCTFMYIPLLDTLQWLVQHKPVQSFLLKRKCSEPFVFTDFHDGTNYTRSEFFQNNPFALQLQIFFDEFETVNPLGSKTGIHKLGGIYFVIRNLLPYHNSTLDCVFLLSLCHSADIKQFGFDTILRPIVDDLKKLEVEGIDVDFIPNQSKLKGTLVALTHDNLGANLMYGFVESFSATNFCRLCTIDKDSVQSTFKEVSENLRTKEQHNMHCIQAEETNSVVCGVKHACIFNELNFFNTCNSPSVDIMHDILEGVAQYDIKLIIKHFVDVRKLFTLEDLNNRIRTFDYGFIERRNRPSPISLDKSGNNIGQRAAQAWCLCRFLPLIIGDLVIEEQDIKVWNILLLLLSIMDIVFAPAISMGMTNHLRELIAEHHSTIKICFPCKRLLPKHHFLVHYPSIIRQMGPLIYLWAMRCEAKHFYFKKLGASLNNFINICKTLSNRHQESLGFNWKDKDMNLNLQMGKGKFVAILTLVHSEMISDFLNVTIDSKVFVTSSVTYSYEYKINYVLCCGFDVRDLPIFGAIVHIFVYDKRAFFVLEQYNTEEHNYHYHSFMIESTGTFMVVDVKSLFCPMPMERHQIYNSTRWFVTPRYLII